MVITVDHIDERIIHILDEFDRLPQKKIDEFKDKALGILNNRCDRLTFHLSDNDYGRTVNLIDIAKSDYLLFVRGFFVRPQLIHEYSGKIIGQH